MFFFFFKQKTAYEMRISDWSSDVCSSDLDAYRIELDGWFNQFEHHCGANRQDRSEQRLAPAACDSRDQNGNAEKEIGLARYKPRFDGVASNHREQDCGARDERRHPPGTPHPGVKTPHPALPRPPTAAGAREPENER